MISFAQYLTEILKSEFQYDHDKRLGDEYWHDAKVNGHDVHVNFVNLPHHPDGHWQAHFEINGSQDERTFNGSLADRMAVLKHVQNVIGHFAHHFKPESMGFATNTPTKQLVANRMAKKVADDHGASYHEIPFALSPHLPPTARLHFNHQ